jgi:hypothetical protein
VQAFDLAARSAAFQIGSSDARQRRPPSSVDRLPFHDVGQMIQVLGVRFFDQFTLTVAKPYIAFVAAGGDAPIKETFNRFAEQNFDRQPGCDGLQINCATD